MKCCLVITKVDINKYDGRITLLWSCLNQRKLFQKLEELDDKEVVIGDNWKMASLILLKSLIEDTGEFCLFDDTPIVNLIILAGRELNLSKNYENLLREFLKQIDRVERDSSHIQQLCPYTDESTIDVYMRTIHSKINSQRKGRTLNFRHFGPILTYVQRDQLRKYQIHCVSMILPWFMFSLKFMLLSIVWVGLTLDNICTIILEMIKQFLGLKLK